MSAGDLATARIALVLEDDESSRFVLRAILEHGGFTVLESAEPAAAIEICRTHPDPLTIVVSDGFLRVRGGPDTVRQMKELQPGMAILFVSGYPLDQLANRGFGAPDLAGGPSNFLQKPFTAQTLLNTIRELIS